MVPPSTPGQSELPTAGPPSRLASPAILFPPIPRLALGLPRLPPQGSHALLPPPRDRPPLPSRRRRPTDPETVHGLRRAPHAARALRLSSMSPPHLPEP